VLNVAGMGAMNFDHLLSALKELVKYGLYLSASKTLHNSNQDQKKIAHLSMSDFYID